MLSHLSHSSSSVSIVLEINQFYPCNNLVGPVRLQDWAMLKTSVCVIADWWMLYWVKVLPGYADIARHRIFLVCVYLSDVPLWSSFHLCRMKVDSKSKGQVIKHPIKIEVTIPCAFVWIVRLGFVLLYYLSFIECNSVNYSLMAG